MCRNTPQILFDKHIHTYMILIADSGSTKTDWRIIDVNKKIHQAQSEGFNPNYDSGNFVASVQQQLLPTLTDTTTLVYFYGAGCSTDLNQTIAHKTLSGLFPQAVIHVHHDLLAAARALCGHQPGIACILGTGSNACFYNGDKITGNTVNLGYLLGDEGSGYYLGKTLLMAYLHQELPDDLAKRFAKRYPNTSREEILENLYHKPYPNRYLASFTKFLFDYQKQPVIYRLIYNCFEEFFDKYILKLNNPAQHPVHFVGSVAFYFSNILRQVANDKNLRTGNILETPIAGLTLYHEEQSS